jgi:hypothetical protein
MTDEKSLAADDGSYTLPRGDDGGGLMLTTGSTVLRGRYELIGPGERVAGEATLWRGIDGDGVHHLIKTWSYDGNEPDPVRRALWDAELRTLYKVGSSPGAGESLVVLRDAGVDRHAKCFVMVLESPGSASVAVALIQRHRHSWLASRDAHGRSEIWSVLERVASGLALLHEQQVLHRDVGAEALIFDDQGGPESVRLGGFEWSVRLGRPLDADPPTGWSSPPERAEGEQKAWRPDDDWFGFGVLCVRLLLDVEQHAAHEPSSRTVYLIGAIAKATKTLTESERLLVSRLIALDPLERISRAEDVLEGVRQIRRQLSSPAAERQDDRPFTLVINPRSESLADYLLDNGLRLHLELGTTAAFNPTDPNHTSGMTDFMRRDLDGGTLYAVPKKDFYVLVGQRLVLRLVQNTDRDGGRSWRMAFCAGVGELRNNDGSAAEVRIPKGRLAVRTSRNVHQDRTIALESAAWDELLPQPARSAELAAELSRFQEFVRATNQIELLLLDATIFPYQIVEGPNESNGREFIVVRERPRSQSRKVLRFFELEKGLEEFLQREMESATDGSGGVILSEETHDALVLPPVIRENQWRVTEVDPQGQTARLEREAFDPQRPPPPALGVLRGAGMPGQTKLIRRRKQAIDLLDRHSYLLRSLAAPGQVYIDTGAAELPVPLDPAVVDAAKRAAIEDILRVRPIYTLQGPPGTGKTTLVAWLLREIFEDDPVAQVLVTAQAHGAVDVLRSRVTEAFEGVPTENRPLAVRLGVRRRSEDATGLGSVENVALDVLQASIGALELLPSHNGVQLKWLAEAREMVSELQTREALGTRANDFVELVKRGANLTYCTTSAGELEALAGDQSFDWSIVEEAGKAHGFDLALPLQAGHRWLLIGDHLQLPPYRYEDYLSGVEALDSVVEALQSLPENASGMLDWEWVASWRERTLEQRREFQDYATDWLRTFKRAFEHCSAVVPEGELQEDNEFVADGRAAGILREQHRMHPNIGELISRAYYNGQLINRTERDGEILDRVRHRFDAPRGIEDMAILWLDIPWSGHDSRTREKGPLEGQPRYTNEAEALALKNFFGALGPAAVPSSELALLSPYNQQVGLLRRRLRDVDLPAGLRLKPSHSGKARTVGTEGFHTVDSFQGNQADVIAVSLVRNNDQPPPFGMGFLNDSSRLNVLLSRAEQLLVVVGSWEFFVRQVATVQLDDTNHVLWHWKQIMTDLQAWFSSGKAVRLPADLRGLK